MNCGHSSDLVVYWGNEPRCLMCEHQELKEKLAAAKAERGHDGNGDDDRHSGLRERLHDTQLALYQANEDKGLLGQRLRSAEKQAADNGGKVLQLHNENERTKKALAAANADIDRLNQMLRKTGYGQGQIDSYAAECEARERAEERLAAAEAAARWLLYDAPGRPYSEVEAFVRERPWLNCLKSSNSPTGGKP